LVFNYSTRDRYNKILEVIKSDNYYLETKGSFEQIAFYTNKCIELLLPYNRDNPIQDGFGSQIYFGYDIRTLERDGLLCAQIKYAAHLITGENKELQKRYLDSSKSKNLLLLKETITQADYRLYILNAKGQETYNYIYEKEKIFYIVVGLIEDDKLSRVTAFLPKNTKQSIAKKIASAIKTEAKPTRIKSPST
jgi:hypothetical protein